MDAQREAMIPSFIDPLWDRVANAGGGRDDYEELVAVRLRADSRLGLISHPCGVRYVGDMRSILPKPADLVFLFDPTGTLKLEDYKLFNALLCTSWSRAPLFSHDERDHSYAVVLRQDTERGVARLKASLNRLSTVQVDLDLYRHPQHLILPYPTTSLIAWGEVSNNGRCVSWEFWPSLWRHIGRSFRWSTVDLRACARIRGLYAFRLYEMLAMFARRQYPIWTVSLTELRRRLGAEATYRVWSRLDHGILQRAVTELNAVSDILVQYGPADQARHGRVERVRFTVTRKEESSWLGAE